MILPDLTIYITTSTLPDYWYIYIPIICYYTQLLVYTQTQYLNWLPNYLATNYLTTHYHGLPNYPTIDYPHYTWLPIPPTTNTIHPPHTPDNKHETHPPPHTNPNKHTYDTCSRWQGLDRQLPDRTWQRHKSHTHLTDTKTASRSHLTETQRATQIGTNLDLTIT